ncbi:MAG: response regulator [Verrucomicrobiota bacterium]|nr:response regulator [Verrucomicrobiota bacterium]
MINIFKRRQAEPAPPQPKNSEGSNLDLLLVESDQRFLKKLLPMIRTARLPDNTSNLNLDVAGSLRDAIDKLEKRRYDIILTDINLSDASGFLVLEELISYGEQSPIVVLSNITNWSMIIQSAQAGISDFLIKKTVDSDVLMRSIFYAIERRRLELKVNRAEKTYRSLVDILPMGLFRTDKTGQFTYSNAFLSEMMGIKVAEMQDRALGEIFQGESGNRLHQGLEKAMTSSSTVELELPFEGEGEKNLIALFVATPLYDSYGKVEGVQSVVVDITNQKQIQAEKEATNALGVLQSGLSTMANELNNALAPILLDAENLRDQVGSDNPPEMIERIEHSVQKARSVLRPFLVSSQPLGPRSELLDPSKIIRHSLDKARVVFSSAISLETNLPDELKSIKGDASLFHKMVLNIVSNAGESMPEGGVVRISANLECLETGDDLCEALSLTPGEYLHLLVVDHGVGIPPHLIQRVFEPFYTTKGNSHAGVGLTETLGIVKNHGGNLRLTSGPSGGTYFHVYIPVEQSSADIAQQFAVVGDAKRSEKSILLVDDEENILKSAAMLLRHHGYEVLTAFNGADALAQFSKHQSEIGLLITDYSMPVMDGPTLVKGVRQLSNSVNILLCTGLEMQESVDEIGELDVNGTIFKPFSAESLAKAVSKYLD